MKIPTHPLWLWLRAAALVAPAAAAFAAKEMPVEPCLIKHAAKLLPWTIKVDSRASGKVKIWDEDPYNNLAKLYSDENPVWRSDDPDAPRQYTLARDKKDYWIAFYPTNTKVDLTVAFTKQGAASKVVKLKVEQRVLAKPLPSGKPTLTVTNPTGSGASFVTGNFGAPRKGPLVTLD